MNNLFALFYNKTILYINNIDYEKDIRINGYIKIIIGKGAAIQIGEKFKLNSGKVYNPIGRNQRSLFVINKNAKLIIGKNVGMSSVAIVCSKKIVFGDNVRVGGNTVFYDTDFHSLKYNDRISIPENKDHIKVKPIYIGNNVFIGGHSLILKGSSIGQNSIVGAGSVVAGNIPSNEIWAGNPARFIKKMDEK
ncbi:acyltransferase [Polaribacter marinivivus]|uniref:Acyltransferase n=1 Tax=Polaribacter marinivivus TaxID=1524260 RepID=A0ABV8RBR4_9FLAO